MLTTGLRNLKAKLLRVLPAGVVKQCHAEDWHWMGMDRNLDLAEKQYSVSYSMSACLYRLEFTMTWLCGKHALKQIVLARYVMRLY